jgi:acetylornithine deacetylase/succinyl-diaminopimelate desuccinylase family protein
MSKRTQLGSVRAQVLEEIDARRDEFVEFLSQVVSHPTENPPGDTVGLADFVGGWLEGQGMETETVEPQPTLKSLLSTFNRERSDQLHFMFNGHLDVFPADDPNLWKIPPFEGRVADGKIHGRGVADMKGGLTASIIAYSLLYRHRQDLPARVSLMTVADEETGGIWGTSWILENQPDWLPDACIIGEPCSPDAVRIGEKGISWLRVYIEGRSYHGSLGLGDNCILRMAEALILLKDVVNLEADIPEALRPIIEKAKTHVLNEDTRGRERLLEQPSFNIGRIMGGIKVNIAPRDVVAEVDIRVPFGLTPQDVLNWARHRLDEAGLEDAKLELPAYHTPATYTDPQHPLAQIIARNATEHYGVEPTFTITTGGTDGRFFRKRGVPTVIYGPRPQNVAALDEYITADDFIAVLKVHACVALDYIAEKARG